MKQAHIHCLVLTFIFLDIYININKLLITCEFIGKIDETGTYFLTITDETGTYFLTITDETGTYFLTITDETGTYDRIIIMKRLVTEKLISWKDDSNKLPLIVYGARQVGKTYIIKDFAKKYYKNYIYVNFDNDSIVSKIFEKDFNINKIISEIEIIFNKKITEKNTLLFFDEIQNKPRILQSLKYFAENEIQYDVIVAGSLLGVAIDRQRHSFPVGKVDIIELKPLSFEEFLWSQNKNELSMMIKNHIKTLGKINPVIHQKILDLFKSFLIIGGLPASINSYNRNKKFINSQNVIKNIINGYLSDMSKYVTKSEGVKIKETYNSIPKQLAKENKKFRYSLIRKDGNLEKFDSPISWLEFAGLVIKSHKIENSLIPLKIYKDNKYFKLYFNDVGILTLLAGIPIIDILHFTEIDNTFFGAIAENYVATCFFNLELPVFYWRSKNAVEIDFLLQFTNRIIPIEVKKGLRTKSKSLNRYKEIYKPNEMIRISSKNFGITNNIISIPLYATEFYLNELKS